MAEYEAYKDSGAAWIGNIPAEWEVGRLKNHLKRTDARNPGGVQVLSLYRELGIVPKDSRYDNHNVTSEDTSNYKYVQPGDFVVNKMKAWQGSVAVSDYEGIVSPAYYVYKFLNHRFHKRYFHYLIRSCYKEEFMRLSAGIRIGQWDLSSDDLDCVLVLLPTIEEQIAIAEFLDAKVAHIDSVIAEAKTSIEEYKAWKASIIYEAVTKGLDPNVEMKDSGVEWIGTVPTGWELPRIKNIAIFMPKCDFSICTSETPITFTPMECIRTGTFENRSKLFGEIEGTYTQYAEGDIVLAKVTPCFENGNVCIMKQLHSGVGMGSSELFVLRPTKIHDRYLFYVLQHSGFKDAACATMTGTGGLKRVSSSFIQNCHIPYPAISVQKRIADYLDDKCSSISNLIAEKETLITDLEAYKKSLIFEVVTGKRKVV